MGETESKKQDGRLKPTISIITLNGMARTTQIKEIVRLEKKTTHLYAAFKKPTLNKQYKLVKRNIWGKYGVVD